MNESRSLRELHGANRESAVLRLLTQLAFAAVAYCAISYTWLFYGGGTRLLSGGGAGKAAAVADGNFRHIFSRAVRVGSWILALIGGKYTIDLM